MIAPRHPISRFDRMTVFLSGIALFAVFSPTATDVLVYDRELVEAGEVWRLWTGHLVHFGPAHMVIDVGLFLVLSHVVSRASKAFYLFALIALPCLITGYLFAFDPDMQRYGGLSAINLSLLLHQALTRTAFNRRDLFWPAVLAAYVIEASAEILRGGSGGGFVQFSDPSITVATTAHLVAAAFGLLSAIGPVLSRLQCRSTDQLPTTASQ